MRVFHHMLTVAVLGAAMLPAAAAAQNSREYIMFIGTYTRQTNSKGIYSFRFDAASGKVTPLGLAAEADNPSFLAIHPNQRFLYAVSESGGGPGRPSGSVSAFTIDSKTGKLTRLNTASSGGGGPCYVTVDPEGKNVLVTNYGTGTVAILPIASDGRLSEPTSVMQHTGTGANPKRQSSPHAHSINVSADNRFAIAADLGIDQLLVYRLDMAKGTLAPNDPPFTKTEPGAGPRHLSFHPNNRYAYVINELNSTVTAYAWDAQRGVLKAFQTVPTLPKDFTGQNTTAEVKVHPSGNFLYGSNRGHDSVAVFSVDSNTGNLSFVEHVPSQGRGPRNFMFDPSGSYLFVANQNTNNIVLFKIDQKTGRLTPTGQTLEVDSPVCIRFIPAN